MTTQTLVSTEEIEAIILDFIGGLAGDEASYLEPEDNLLTSGLVDSVGIMRLITHLKERLDITVPPTDLVPANFRTIRIMAAYMQSRLEP